MMKYTKDTINQEYDRIVEILSAHNHCGETKISDIHNDKIVNILNKLTSFISKYDKGNDSLFTEEEIGNLDRVQLFTLCSHYIHTAYDIISEIKFTDKSYELFQDIADMSLEYNVLYSIMEYSSREITYRIYTLNDNGSGMKFNTKDDFIKEMSLMIDDFIINGGTSFVAEITSNASCFCTDEAKEECPYKEPTTYVVAGQCGSTVKWVQWYLRKHGYNIEATGYYSAATKDAVKDFQRHAGLIVDGIVGINTIEALKTIT